MRCLFDWLLFYQPILINNFKHRNIINVAFIQNRTGNRVGINYSLYVVPLLSRVILIYLCITRLDSIKSKHCNVYKVPFMIKLFSIDSYTRHFFKYCACMIQFLPLIGQEKKKVLIGQRLKD